MILLILCSLIWAFSYGLIKTNLTGLQADFVSCMRMAAAFALFVPFLRIRNLPLSKILSYTAIGLIQYGLMYIFCIRAYQYLPAYQVVLFTAFTPIYVTLIHDIFSHSFRPFYLITGLLALTSVLLLYYKSLTFHSSLLGFFLVQLSDLCFAFGQVAYKKLKSQDPDLKDQDLYGLLFLGGLIITSFSTSLFHGWNNFFLLSSKQAFTLLYLGAIASGLCFFWWNKAATKTHTGTLAVFNNTKIPLGIFVSLVLFKEQADITLLSISLSLIVLAIFLSEKRAKKTLA